MTYFEFLARFLLVPILLLAGLAWIDRRRGKMLPERLRAHSPTWTLAVLVLVAVTYTTPWDNYLVASGVWWYDPTLVTGLLLGWVPIEEYIFFVLETVLAGLWTLALARHLRLTQVPTQDRPRTRWTAALALAPFWLWAMGTLVLGWQPGAYLALLLAWALPPLALQLAFGADLLWRDRRLASAAILGPAIYLSWADTLALGAGTWTINPEQSLHLLVAGVLPIEELVFFILTNTLVVFGMVLALSEEGRVRLVAFACSARARLQVPQMRIPTPDALKTGKAEE